jgi:glycosyltransferase involved in cell wall biosynthesis
MKILFLSRRFYPDQGGVEKHILEISRILIKKGYKITVVTQSKGDVSSVEEIDIIRIPKIAKNKSEKLYIWKWFWKNRKLISEADIIHAHDVLFWYWPFKVIFLSKKCFVTFHGYETYPIKKKAIISRKISEIFANGNIIVGGFIKKWYKTKPDYVIYGGVDISKIIHSASTGSSKNQISKIKNIQSAVFIGRLDEHTGILDYAKAVDIILIKFPNFKFKILGEGKYLSKLFRYKPLGFKNNPENYLIDNNFAFVSRYLSILEAFSSKRLVIAHFDNPVKEDYLKLSPFAKYMVIENSPEKLAEKIIFYLNNPKKAENIIDNAYKWVSNRTWDSVVDVYLKLWDKQ